MDKETIEQLKGLAELRDAGVLNQEEFETQKKSILNKEESGESASKTENVENMDPPDEDALTKSLKVVDYRKIIDEWRIERAAERKRFVNRVIKKVSSKEISITRRIPKKNKLGEKVDIGELITRSCELYREAGYTVVEGDRHLRLAYQGTADSEVGVNIATIACVMFVERPSTWQVVVRGELDFWTSKFDRLLAAAFLVVLFAIFFWPCLFCIPYMFEVDPDQLKQKAEESVLAPLIKMLDDYKTLEL